MASQREAIYLIRVQFLKIFVGKPLYGLPP
jgi:hypothetical protein